MAYDGGKQNSVLIVAGTKRACESIAGALSPSRFWPVATRSSAAEARRLLVDTPFSIVIVNLPLPDEFGTQLAQDLTADRLCGIVLLVPAETYEQVSEQMEDAGVLTVCKPCSAQTIRQTLSLLAATRAKLVAMERRTVTLEEKMEEIRVVNRAKWMLIERRGMDEASAHRYIEKLAMDARQTRRLVAQTLIRSLDAGD
mgnify:FL=1